MVQRRFQRRNVVWMLAVLWTAALPFTATAEDDPPPMLLGACDAAALAEAPYDEWFQPGYDDYTADPETLAALRALPHDDIEVTVFFGTWCGDSRREVPRWLSLIDSLDWPQEQRRLVAVDRAEALHKRSPDGEEQGYGIFRVPTIVVQRDGHEIGRIVEHPVLSLERDLLSILQGEEYRASYASYPVVRRWLAQGLLTDANVNADGLASQVRHLVASQWELYSAARVLWSRGDVREAASIAEVNCALFWQDAACHMQLAEAQIRAGDLEKARTSVLRAMRRNDDPDRVETLVDLIERTMTDDPEDGDD